MVKLAQDGLPVLRAVIAAHQLSAKKTLGQNFLLDLNLTRKIARQAGDLTQGTIVEIGPGPGGLTRALLAQGAQHVIAIERDERVKPALDQIAAHYPNRLRVIYGDALAIELSQIATPPVKIIANLPYNIATELLIRWLTPPEWPPIWDSLTLMFQREVAQRITAQAGSKTYGRLSILAQWRSEARHVMDLPASAFTPAPKVDSAIVHFQRLEKPRFAADPKKLERVVAAAFGQRRKMLRASLKQLGYHDLDALFKRAEISPTQRAEHIDLEGFCHLANAWR